MSRAPIQDIEVSADDSALGGTVHKHPAFAQIGASRVSGGASLYGSDFQHQNFVRIHISGSEMRRSLSNDWPFSRRTYIEVDLSEAQWASFVSSMNVGQGILCTLRYQGGEQIPELPPAASRRDQFKDEAKATCKEAMKRIDELCAEISELKISQKAKDELVKRARRVSSTMTSSLPFVLDQFAEHMETTVEKAKIEINAYAVNTVMRAGIASLGGAAGEMPVIQFNESKS